MNIGIFSDTYEPQINGVVTSIKTLKKELEKRGHNVYVFTTSDPNSEKNETNIYRLPSLPLILSPQHRLATMYSIKYSSIIKNLKLDIIHNQTEFSLGIFSKIVSKRFNIPIVHTYHTMWEDYTHYIVKKSRGKLTPMAVRLISRLFCNRFSTVIAPTEKTKQALIRYGVHKPIVVIPTGIDLTPFSKSNFPDNKIKEIKNNFNIPENDKIITFIGRVAHEKSIDVIIKQLPNVLSRVPNVKFVIVGDGPAKEGLMTLTNELKLNNNVIFLGKQPWENVPMFYNIADLFISASTSETQGLTFLEAMAAGTPVIARNDKSLEGFINNNVNGKLFNESSEIPNIICELLSDNNLCSSFSKAALETASMYSAERFGERIESLYMDTIKKSFNTTL